MHKGWLIGAFGVSVALLAGVVYPRAKQPIQNTLPVPLTKADSFIEGMAMEAFSASGHLAWQITATDSLHTVGSHTTLIHNPHFLVYEANGKEIHWQVQSQSATAYHQGNMRSIHHIDLASNVALTLRPQTKNSMILRTETATFTPQTGTLTSIAPVQIESPQGNVEGIGLSANLKNGTLKILNGVKGTYGKQN